MRCKRVSKYFLIISLILALLAGCGHIPSESTASKSSEEASRSSKEPSAAIPPGTGDAGANQMPFTIPDNALLACIKAVSGATLTQAEIPSGDGRISAPGTIFSQGGSFTAPKKEGDPEPKGVSIGPFEVASGGRLKGTVNGEPAVAGGWSMGNYNTAMTVYFEPKIGNEYGAGQEIMSLSGQLEYNHLTQEVDISGPGRISAWISPPVGYGPLSGGYFDQSYTCSLELVSVSNTITATPGKGIHSGDSLKTGSGSALITLAGGSSAIVMPNSEITLTPGATKSDSLNLPASNYYYDCDLLAELFKAGMPMPEGIETEASIKEYLYGFHDGTLDEVKRLWEQNKDDPYEASVQIKLMLEGNRGQWTVNKLLGDIWEVKGPDKFDLLEKLAEKFAKSTVPMIGMVSMLDDAKSLIEVIEQNYHDGKINAQYKAAQELFGTTRGMSPDKLEDKISGIRRDIGALESRLERLQNDFISELMRLQPDPSLYGRPPLFKGDSPAWDQYWAKSDELTAQFHANIAPILSEITGEELKIKVLQDYRLNRPVRKTEAPKTADKKDLAAPICHLDPRINVQVELKGGTISLSGGPDGGHTGQVQIKQGNYTVVPEGTDFVCTQDGGQSLIMVASGKVSVTDEKGKTIRLTAGQQIRLPEGGIEAYTAPQEDPLLYAGLPLGDIPLSNSVREPFGKVGAAFGPSGIPSDWVWQDPGNDAVLKTLSEKSVQITVPDGNDFWDRRTDAPRLLRKVSGDFILEGQIRLDCVSNHLASAEPFVYAPGSSTGYWAGQMNMEAQLAPHYRIFDGGWLRYQGCNKLSVKGIALDILPEIPDDFIHFRITRHEDLWRTYWSLDGENWQLASRTNLRLPDTVWVGWVFKRLSLDNTPTEPAVATLKDITLISAERSSLPGDPWDDSILDGTVQEVDESTIRLTLDGSKIGTVTASMNQMFEGDFDVTVRYDAAEWTHQDGQCRRLWLYASDLTDKNYAYMGLFQNNNHPLSYSTDLMTDSRYRGYRSSPTADTRGWLRMVRKEGVISTYFWLGNDWQRLDEFNSGFSGPVYLGVAVDNSWEAGIPAAHAADFTIEKAVDYVQEKPWKPAGGVERPTDDPVSP